MRTIITIALFIFAPGLMNAQQVVHLYEGTIPNAQPCSMKPEEFIDTTWDKNGILIARQIVNPTITVYEAPAEKRNGVGVLICPGGGYSVVAAGHEGADVALAFNDAGITAFVLRYRLPNDSCMTNKAYVPLMDAQQAMYLIRKNAQQYGVDPHKTGIMGFSAGGHLASSAGTHFNNPVRKELTSADVRPDFMMLIYPVISFKDSIAHTGSRENLIGKEPEASLQNYFSNEEQVTAETPPTFLVHASDDDGVMPENSIVFYQALIKNKVPAELHIYEHGGHGFGSKNSTTNDKWFERCINWIKANGWME